MNTPNRIENFPVSFFAMIMGMSGLTIAWQKAAHVLHVSNSIGTPLVWITCLLFIGLALIYSLKLARHRHAVTEELRHPVKLNFFPAISISLILLSIVFLSIHQHIALILWLAGVVLHLGLTLYVMSVWIHHDRFEIHHINPAWFIPVVGNVLVPITGTALGYTEISWFFFSIGIIFWVVLFTIIFYRVLFHQPLPEKLMPTFFILIAPPAVGFLSYAALIGGLDSFARVLYYVALFLTLLLLTQLPRFAKLQFFLSWWAYSFPLAAITISSMKMFELTQKTGFVYLSWTLLTLLTLVVGYLLFKTSKAVQNHKICLPDA
jgi:tellurite resistance protein